MTKKFPKFDVVSPVWLQVYRKGASDYELNGLDEPTDNKDWINDMKKSKQKICPLVLFENFKTGDFLAILNYQMEIDSFASVLFEACFDNKLNGIVLEIWATLGTRVNDANLYNLIITIARKLKSGGFEFYLTVPPLRDDADVFNNEHFETLWNEVNGFLLMSYDYSDIERPGANAPLYWIRDAVENIAPSSNPHQLIEKRAKILMGLNFYGYDYTPDGGEPIIGSQCIDFLKYSNSRLKYDETDVENYFEVK